MRQLAGILLATGLALAGAGMPEFLAAEPPSTSARGPRGTLAAHLQQRAGVSWAAQPLRAIVVSLRTNWDVPLFLDRRIDPDQRIDLEVSDGSLAEILTQLAAAAGGEARVIDELVYLGPPAVVDTIAALADERYEQARQLSAARAQKLRHRAALRWEELTEPRALITEQAASAELRVVGGEHIVHDLWAAQQWPALPLTHRLTLLLAGFDLTYRVDDAAGTLIIEPIAPQQTFERGYTLSGEATERLAALEDEFPAARFVRQGRRVLVTATAAEHQRIRTALAPPMRPPAGRPRGGGELRYTLSVRGPFGGIAKSLAERLQLELTLADDTRAQWDESITVNVRDATLPQLLEALVEPVGLAYELKDKKLRIYEQAAGE